MFSAMASYTILTAKTATPKIRVACVGDSITQGSGYPSKLQELLGSNYTVGNFGVSGSTVSLNSSLPYMKQAAFFNAENFNPDIVLIMLGTNDANSEIAYNEDNFEADYIQLVTSFEGLTSTPQIWVIKSPPIFSVDSNYSNTYLTSTIFPQIDELTTQMNLPTMNMYSVLENHSEYFFDGVHPNTDGANLIASNIYNSITSFDYSTADEIYF
jgi:lysophospholipase L1-like esterase